MYVTVSTAVTFFIVENMTMMSVSVMGLIFSLDLEI